MNKIIMKDFGLTYNSCHGGFQVALQLFLDVTFRCFKKGMSGLGVMTLRPLMHSVCICGQVGIVYISAVPVHVLKKRMGVLWLRFVFRPCSNPSQCLLFWESTYTNFKVY